MAKFLGCIFGYIILSSFIAGTVVNYGPRWALYVFLVLFLVGWVFIAGFATCERATLKEHVQQGVEFVKGWGFMMLCILGGAFVLALLTA